MTLPLQIIVPFALMTTLLSCWFLPRVITLALAVCTVGLGLVVNVIDLEALPALVGLGLSGWWLGQQRGLWLWRWVAGAVFIALSIILAHHWWPGFHNIRIWDDFQIKAGSASFTLFYNVDKPWIGLVILLSCIPLLKTASDWRKAFTRVLLPVVIMLPVVFTLGLLSGFVRWQPELPEMAWVFLLNNLLFTALAEEAFFRGFIQKALTEHWQKYSWGSVAALLVASVLFGLAHYAGGIQYVALAAISGAFYGWSYQRTGSLEMAIFSHWLLNACHFLLFSYPVAN